MSNPPKALILSAYNTPSHARWCKRLQEFTPEFSWTVLNLPGRYFSWRYSGNALSFSQQYAAELEQDYAYVVATSMVNLSVLRGLHPKLTRAVNILYCHENQLDYPLQDPKLSRDQAHFALQNIYTLLAADKIIYNSSYNRESTIRGLRQFLQKMPDLAGCDVQKIQEKSEVIPVPIEQDLYVGKKFSVHSPIRMLWNHRWEYDKGPERLLAFLERLEEEQIAFQLALLGQSFRKIPKALQDIQANFSEKLTHIGHIETLQEYHQVIAQSDIVLSTALHEFQGLSMIESIAQGCIPLAPNRLVYPEYIPAPYLYTSNENPIREAKSAVQTLRTILDFPEHNTVFAKIKPFSSAELRTGYRGLFGL